MPSKRETILARIATTLASTSGVSGRVYRSRVEPLARGESPALVIEPSSDQATLDTVATLFWTLTVRITCVVRSAIPDQAADAVMLDAHAKLMADTTLGGLVVDIVPGTMTFELIEADQAAGVISVEYQVTYRTSRDSLS